MNAALQPIAPRRVVIRAGNLWKSYDKGTIAVLRGVDLVAVEGGEMGSVLALVAAGLGAAVVPGIVTTGETRLRVTRFRKPPPTRTIALVHRDDRVPSRAADALAAAFTDVITAAGWPGPMPQGMRLLR